MRRIRVLFVASLQPQRDGFTGGQVSEAGTLFGSRLREVLELVPISGTNGSLPPPPVAIRIWDSAKRLAKFLWKLPGADVVLLYPASGLSLVEKACMSVVARWASRGVVVRLTSGGIFTDCKVSPLLDRCLHLLLKNAHFLPVQGRSWAESFAPYPETEGKLGEIYNGLVLPPPTSGQTERRPDIAYVGWMVKEKGIFEALEVFKRVRLRYPEAQFTLAGGGTDLNAFAAKVRDEGLTHCVHLQGWIPKNEVLPLLAKSDVFLFASHYEGMPNAVLEAMASGLPVITTRVGALPEIIRHGENGLLANVHDVDTLTENMLRVLGDEELSIRMGQNARSTIEEHFDIERVWPKYLDILTRAAVLAGRASSPSPKQAPVEP